MGGILADASKLPQAVEFLEVAITEAAEREVEEYRADMLARLSRAHMRLSENDSAITRANEALAIAEPRRLTRIIAEAFINKAAALGASGGIREPEVLMSAAIELAAEAGDTTLELRARNNFAAVLSVNDGDRSQAVLREAYALATRLGVSQMSQWIIGAIASGAVAEGLDWDDSVQGLDAELELTRSAADRSRLLSVRVIFMRWRGEDVEEVLAEIEANAGSISDPDADAWLTYYGAITPLLEGRTDEAFAACRRALVYQSANRTDFRFGLALSAHLARDLEVAREALEGLGDETMVGYLVEGVAAVSAGGVAALEGRRGDALTHFRSAIHAFERSGNRFYVALTQLDALSLMPEEPAITDWADEARERFRIIKAPPLLALLDAAVAGRVTA
jgi:tetratricopeptide (TPR) repeat protein